MLERSIDYSIAAGLLLLAFAVPIGFPQQAGIGLAISASFRC